LKKEVEFSTSSKGQAISRPKPGTARRVASQIFVMLAIWGEVKKG